MGTDGSEWDNAIKQYQQQPVMFAARPKEITIEQLFPTGSYLNIRVGMTWSVGDENPTDVMKAAMDLANNFHRQHFPMLYEKDGKPKFTNYTGEEPVIQKQGSMNENEKIGQYTADLLLCTELDGKDGLLSYEAFVKQINNKTVTATYELMLKKLTK